MAHNPVQVVLNTERYMKKPENGGGGSGTDFFEGRDAEFVKHRDKILEQFKAVREQIAPQSAPVAFVKVKLQAAALAKSHRPMEAIFKASRFPLVGTGGLGELFFEVTRDAFPAAEKMISGAEAAVTKRNKKDELVPSPARSEVGAIESISVPRAKDARRFTADEAVKYFQERPAGRYLAVELFIDESELEADPVGRIHAKTALKKFREKLTALTEGLQVWRSGKEWKSVHLTVLKFPVSLPTPRVLQRMLATLMDFLDESPLVRRYSLGPVLMHAATGASAPVAAMAPIPPPSPKRDYPIVGIVDGGVTRTGPLAAWSAGSINFMRQVNADREHGSFIAGILVNGHNFNPGQPGEHESCKFFDFDLYCEDEAKFQANFGGGFVDMMRQLDAQLSAKPKGLRIINLSLNPETLADPNGYSFAAGLLDELADNHDVIFVVSAGNLDAAKLRTRWPVDPTPALQQIASYPHLGQDRVYVPGETARNITVGALELFDADKTRPALYTRRGPATSAGVKPDFAHVGGCVASKRPLISSDTNGGSRAWHGTSFAAPMVAKSLAVLDHRIAGPKPRELLLGLMYHFAQMPAVLNDKLLKDVSKDFAGFGVPASVDSMLTCDDHSITLVFMDSLPEGHELSFDFAWPQDLYDANTQTRRGDVALTIAYTPPIEGKHQAEFTRVNLEAYLRQETIDDKGEVKYKGRLTSEHSGSLEKNLIEHGAKWWPVKHYRRSFKRLGGTANWRLVVDSLTRAGSVYPAAGVKFAVILTISDPRKDNRAGVFSSIRRGLITNGVELKDVRSTVATRVRAG